MKIEMMIMMTDDDEDEWWMDGINEDDDEWWSNDERIELKLSSKILTWQLIYSRREASSLQN